MGVSESDERSGEKTIGLGIIGPSEIMIGLQTAAAEISKGEVWNGLARLRRAIEIRLYEIARQYGETGQRMSVSALLDKLMRREVIPQEAVRHLKHAVAIANRGIHGENVTRERRTRDRAHQEVRKDLLSSAQGQTA